MAMTYSNGPGGYGAPQQQPNQQSYGPQPYGQAGPGAPTGPSMAAIANIVVIAFGVLSFLLGFAPYAAIDIDSASDFGSDESFSFFNNGASGAGTIGLALLLLAALVAAVGLLPKQTKNEGLVAALSVTGFLILLVLLIGLSDGMSVGVGFILVLVVAFLQAAVAIGALLFAADIIKPRPPAPYGGYYPQGAYGQQPAFGPPAALAPPAPQAPQYGAPPQAPGYGAPGYQQHPQ